MPEQHTQPERGHRFVIVVAIIAALGGLLFGYDTGVISGAILFIRGRFHLSSTMVEVTTSTVLVGAVLGAAAGGRLADAYGRRRMIIIAAIVFAGGAIGTSAATTVWWLIAGRFVVGLAIGVASFVAPLYISEMAPAKVRGRLVTFNQLAVTIGIVVSYLIDYAFAGIKGWRWMFGLAAIPAIALGLGIWRMPDSPRWLIARGQEDKGRQVLQRIRGTAEVEGKANEIKTSLGRQSEAHWEELLKPGIRPALIVGLGLAILQQVTGINTVIYYSPIIFQLAGLTSSSTAILATAGVGVVNAGMTGVAAWLIDRVGRRPLLLIGLAGMVVALGALGAAFAFHGLSHLRGWIAIISLMVYVGSFAIGMGPVFWLMISEIYPLRVRGLAMSIATIANWGANLLVALTFLSLIGAIGKPFTFWLYAVLGIAAFVFSYFLVPETKGHTLEEIEAHWQAGRHPRQLTGKRTEEEGSSTP